MSGGKSTKVLISLLAVLLLPVFPVVQAQTMTIEIKDIEYARDAGKALALDLYLPKDKPGVPLVVWVPGGAWQFAPGEVCCETKRAHGAGGTRLCPGQYRFSPGPRGECAGTGP